MEKELKDMTKEEIDALIHEYYENHQRLWMKISDILEEFIKEIVIYQQVCVHMALIPFRDYGFTTVSVPLLKCLALDDLNKNHVFYNCYACELDQTIRNSYMKKNIFYPRCYFCMLNFWFKEGQWHSPSYALAFCESDPKSLYKKFKEVATCIVTKEISYPHLLDRLSKARIYAIQIANLPLREFDYEQMCFK